MGQVITWNGLELVLMNIIKECIYEVGMKVNDLLKQNIQTDVYDFGDPSEYIRTYDFLNSVTTSDVRLEGKSASVEVYPDTSKISSNSENFQHGSKFWDMEDISSIIPELLAFNLSGDLFHDGFWKHRKNYYYDTLDALENGGQLRKWFLSALKSRGINAK